MRTTAAVLQLALLFCAWAAATDEQPPQPPPVERSARRLSDHECTLGFWVVVWHMWDAAEGFAFSSEEAARQTYDTLDGGDYAARMYDTERNIIAQYGVMGENDWAMLDEWGRSCPPSSPPGGASPKAGAYAAMAVGGVVILGCLVAHRHHILHCVSPCTGEDCRPRLLTRLLARRRRRASTTPTAPS